jgi:ubiquinone/menaquinone biosynthesis C-methylase UbiE
MSHEQDSVRAFEYAAWQRVAHNYGSSFAGATSRFVPAVLDAAAAGPGVRLLDVGCGPGIVCKAAAARGAEVTGVDFSPAMLAVARQAHPAIAFVEGDMQNLPFADASFDAAVSNFGIHHAPDPAAALAQMHRVLARGGRIAFATWINPAENIAWKLLYDAVRAHGDLAKVKAPPPGGGLTQPEDVAQALRRVGFGDIDVELRRDRWRLASAKDLVACLRDGTARTAAVIEAQEPSRLGAITASIADNAEQYRDGDALLVPIAALVARAKRIV